MLSISFGKLAILCNLISGIVGGNGDTGCFTEFKNLKAIDAASDKCLAKLNLKEEDLVMPKDLSNNGFDDKCFIKCVMTEMKYVKDDGTVDFKVIEDDFKKNAPSGKADALVAVMKDCVESTSKDAVIMKNPCKALAKIKVCYLAGQDKICPHV